MFLLLKQTHVVYSRLCIMGDCLWWFIWPQACFMSCVLNSSLSEHFKWNLYSCIYLSAACVPDTNEQFLIFIAETVHVTRVYMAIWLVCSGTVDRYVCRFMRFSVIGTSSQIEADCESKICAWSLSMVTSQDVVQPLTDIYLWWVLDCTVVFIMM